MTVRGQSFIDNGLSTRFVTHVPQIRDDWDKGFKDKVYHIVTQLLYQHGPRDRKGGECFKDNVYHFWHPPTSPVLLIVAKLLGSTKGGPIVQWALRNPSFASSHCTDNPIIKQYPYLYIPPNSRFIRCNKQKNTLYWFVKVAHDVLSSLSFTGFSVHQFQSWNYKKFAVTLFFPWLSFFSVLLQQRNENGQKNFFFPSHF